MLSYANGPVSSPLTPLSSNSSSNPPLIDDSDYNLSCLGGESLLLDVFYENLLRKNALSALTGGESGQLEDEQGVSLQSPQLHFDVTKLSAINSSTAEIGASAGRCPTVTKSRIDLKNNPHQHSNGHASHVSGSSKDTDKGNVAVERQGAKQTHPNSIDRLLGRTSTKMTLSTNRKAPGSPHTTARHKIVKTEWSNLNLR